MHSMLGPPAHHAPCSDHAHDDSSPRRWQCPPTPCMFIMLPYKTKLLRSQSQRKTSVCLPLPPGPRAPRAPARRRPAPGLRTCISPVRVGETRSAAQPASSPAARLPAAHTSTLFLAADERCARTHFGGHHPQSRGGDSHGDTQVSLTHPPPTPVPLKRKWARARKTPTEPTKPTRPWQRSGARRAPSGTRGRAHRWAAPRRRRRRSAR